MTITATDIKLLASERMTDTSDGGGRRTGNVIADGVAGNIFPKVSRLDSVYGRVNMRKVFGAVQTPNLDTYAGAHAVIIDPPDNDKIVVNLFTTGNDFDTRNAARDRIESYVISGPESRMTLMGRQLVGQMAVAAYQNVTDPLPDIGEVYCLSTETGGVVSYQQYVRIIDMTHEVRTFTDDQGDYTRRVVTLKLSSPLRYEFDGPDGAARFSNTSKPALVRTTSAADAARYYGIQPLLESADAEALTVKVASVYASIVPTTQRETPLSNAQISGANNLAATGAATTFQFPDFSVNVGQGTYTMRLPGAVKPGSVTLTQIALGIQGNGWVLTDNGKGTLLQPGDTVLDANGSIDYETGVITVQAYRGYSAWRNTVSYVPATEVTQIAHTLGLDVTLASRGAVWVETLHPLPAVGTLVVDYRALGKWYRLRDDGTGKVVGDDPTYGTGSIDYASGALVVTLGALPDVGSRLMFAWASPVHYEVKANATTDAGATVKQRIMLPNIPVQSGNTVQVHYTSGGVALTGSDAVTGVISGGSITGSIDYATGQLDIEFTSKLPDAATHITVNYKQEAPSGATPTSVAGSLTVTDTSDMILDTGGQTIAAKGLRMQIPVAMNADGKTGVLDIADDGNGHLVTLNQTIKLAYVGGVADTVVITAGQIVGTVNYDTGEVSIGFHSLASSTYLWNVNSYGWVIAASPYTP